MPLLAPNSQRLPIKPCSRRALCISGFEFCDLLGLELSAAGPHAAMTGDDGLQDVVQNPSPGCGVTEPSLFILQKSRFPASEISHLLEHVSMIRGAAVLHFGGSALSFMIKRRRYRDGEKR